MGKKIFWLSIVLILVFDFWLVAKLTARKSASPAKIESSLSETGGPNSAQPDTPTPASRNSGQATVSQTTTMDQTVKPAEVRTAESTPAEAKPVKRISTKNIKDLKSALATGLPIILKLGSDSCYPCKLMKPILKELAQEQDGRIVVLDLDFNEQVDLAREYKIRLIPAIIFYDKQGRAKSVHEGYLDKKQLLEWVDYLGLER